jgi:hypothetical protein
MQWRGNLESMHHDLGSEALGCMRAELSQGGPLAKRLVAIPPKGKVFSILPPDTSRADLIDFGSGGVAAGDESA